MAYELFKEYITDVPDFPKKGITFKDIAPLLGHEDVLGSAICALTEIAQDCDLVFNKVAGIESRGFIFGAPLAVDNSAGFVLVRKPGKLPGTVLRQEYDLEYGTDAVELQESAVSPGDQVLVVDDVLATGGTAAATVKLLEQAGATVVGCLFLIELDFLSGRQKLEGYEVASMLHY